MESSKRFSSSDYCSSPKHIRLASSSSLQEEDEEEEEEEVIDCFKCKKVIANLSYDCFTCYGCSTNICRGCSDTYLSKCWHCEEIFCLEQCLRFCNLCTSLNCHDCFRSHRYKSPGALHECRDVRAQSLIIYLCNQLEIPVELVEAIAEQYLANESAPPEKSHWRKHTNSVVVPGSIVRLLSGRGINW